MVHYSAYLAIWSVGMLLVSGLDVTIVGHFDFKRTAFYAIAVMPTNLLLLVISSVIGPMMPASAAMSTRRSPIEMGVVFMRVSRYAVLLLLLVGLPLIVFGYPILRIWVGAYYAANCLLYLRILLLANIIRNACLPYATMVIATGRQKAATGATVAEAVVNVAASVFLASRFGAIGVAYGTLLGSLVSLSMHLMLSMKLTQDALHFSRRNLLVRGFARAATVTGPSICVLALQRYSQVAANQPATFVAWFVGTALLTWLIALDRRDREEFLGWISHAFSNSVRSV
jgi:O-antigen/teichoic acid export membrane protein